MLAAKPTFGHMKTLQTPTWMGSTVLAAAVPYPGKVTRSSCKGQRSTKKKEKKKPRQQETGPVAQPAELYPRPFHLLTWVGLLPFSFRAPPAQCIFSFSTLQKVRQIGVSATSSSARRLRGLSMHYHRAKNVCLNNVCFDIVFVFAGLMILKVGHAIIADVLRICRPSIFLLVYLHNFLSVSSRLCLCIDGFRF